MAKEASLAELKAGRMPERYLRNLGTIGLAGQLRLLQAKVVVVGAGGLGGYVLECLARQGVGQLGVIDGDNFAAHNLNRQILCTTENLGRSKAQEAARRLAAVNPEVEVTAVAQMLTTTTAQALLAGADVVVDALDSLRDRSMLFQAAGALGIPVVHGAIAGFTGQVAVLFPEDTYLAVFLTQKAPAQGVEAELGNPAATPAMAAALQAQETVKLLTGTGRILRNEILYFDMEQLEFEKIRMPQGGIV